MTAAKDNAKPGCPIPAKLHWPQLNSALFSHMVSLSEDKEHPFGKFPEKEDFSTRGPITTRSLPGPSLFIQKRCLRWEKGYTSSSLI